MFLITVTNINDWASFVMCPKIWHSPKKTQLVRMVHGIEYFNSQCKPFMHANGN